MSTIIRTVAELWPDHADHDVRYSEFGRTDYALRSVELQRLDETVAEYAIVSHEYQPAPIDGRVDEINFWCADCGQRLPDYVEDNIP